MQTVTTHRNENDCIEWYPVITRNSASSYEGAKYILKISVTLRNINSLWKLYLWAGIIGNCPIGPLIFLARVGGSYYLKFPPAHFSGLLEAVIQYASSHVISTWRWPPALQPWSASLAVWKLSWRWIGRGRGPYAHLTWILSKLFCGHISEPRSMSLQSILKRNCGFEFNSLQVK